MAYNVFGLGEGGLVGCSKLAVCFCPLLPNPCYMKCRLFYDKAQLNDKQKNKKKKSDGRNLFERHKTRIP
jgi:hypothetical protein